MSKSSSFARIHLVYPLVLSKSPVARESRLRASGRHPAGAFCEMAAVIFCGRRIPFDFDPALGIDVLRSQIFSLVGVSDSAQQIFAKSLENPSHPSGSLPRGSLVQSDEDITLLPPDETFGLLDDRNCYLPALANAATPSQASAAAGACASSETCTRIFAAFPILQPRFVYSERGSDHSICSACAATCKSGVPGSVMPAPLAPCTNGDGLELGTCFACACASAGGGCLFSERYGAEVATLATSSGAHIMRALGSAADVQAGREGIQALRALAASGGHGDTERMLSRLGGMLAAARRYDDAGLLARARQAVPIATLLQRVVDAPARERRPDAGDELLRQLAIWFRSSFFKWVNGLSCPTCGGGTSAVGGVQPNAAERVGLAGVTELHRCTAPGCGATARFPRYNNPDTLLTWRQGRCGEWANAFTLCALALGFQARHVTDWTDHVWTEVFSPYEGRWLHVDACETAIDAPLLYSLGWGKKL